MAKTAIAKDYALTISPERYVNGIAEHIWLGAMYARMKHRVLEEVRILLAINRRQVIQIYDFGCGPGHFTNNLHRYLVANIGEDRKRIWVTGFDKSPKFIAYAMKTSKEGRLRGQDTLSFVEKDVLEMSGCIKADIIVTSGFFHHFKPDQKPAIVKKVATFLLKNGILIDGDEHRAPTDMFESWRPGQGIYLSLCALYFQVIAAALSIRNHDLVWAETENFLAEAFRGQMHKYLPASAEDVVTERVAHYAGRFMDTLYKRGLHEACAWAFELREWLSSETATFGSSKTMVDRGDFKDTLSQFVTVIQMAGFQHESTYDPGHCNILGSAPVTVFRKLI